MASEALQIKRCSAASKQRPDGGIPVGHNHR